MDILQGMSEHTIWINNSQEINKVVKVWHMILRSDFWAVILNWNPIDLLSSIFYLNTHNYLPYSRGGEDLAFGAYRQHNYRSNNHYQICDNEEH